VVRLRVANTALGGNLVPGAGSDRRTITLNYGYTNATVAILSSAFIIFCCGLPIAYHAAKCASTSTC